MGLRTQHAANLVISGRDAVLPYRPGHLALCGSRLLARLVARRAKMGSHLFPHIWPMLARDLRIIRAFGARCSLREMVMADIERDKRGSA